MTKDSLIPSYWEYFKTAVLHPRAWPQSSEEVRHRQPYLVISGTTMLFSLFCFILALLGQLPWVVAIDSLLPVAVACIGTYLVCAASAALAWQTVRFQSLLGEPIDDLDEQ